MRILAIESTAKAASAALCEDGRLLGLSFMNCGLTHSVTLLPMVEGLLKSSGFAVRDMDAVAVAKGPGSFTGVRIGVAAAKGLAWAAEKPCRGVSTLEAMAWQVSHMADVLLCPVMDARRQQVYNALFDPGAPAPVRLCGDRAISLEALAEDIRARGRRPLLIGDGASLCFEALGRWGIEALMPPEPLRQQSAWGVALSAFGAEDCPPEELTPVYLRLSQAERERLAREDKK